MRLLQAIVGLVSLLLLSSCQIPKNPEPESLSQMTRGQKVSTPQFQLQENRQKRMKDDLKLLGSTMLLLSVEMLQNSSDEEDQGSSSKNEKDFLDIAWREGVERPVKKAYKKVFD